MLCGPGWPTGPLRQILLARTRVRRYVLILARVGYGGKRSLQHLCYVARRKGLNRMLDSFTTRAA